jgi:hypothetical protein
LQVEDMMACPSSAAAVGKGGLQQPWRAEMAELMLTVAILEARLDAQQTSAAGILPCDLILGYDGKKATLKTMCVLLCFSSVQHKMHVS